MVLKVTHLGFHDSPSKPWESFSKLPFNSKERNSSSSRSFSSVVMALGASRLGADVVVAAAVEAEAEEEVEAVVAEEVSS